MAFIIETPQTHPGIKQYVCRKEASGRRPQYEMRGVRAEAVEFDSEAAADIAIMQFSSLYSLEKVKV